MSRHAFPPQNCHCHRESIPPSNTWFLGSTKTASQLVQLFLHSLWQKIPILYNGCSFPTKLPLPMGGTTPHLIQFLEPIQAHNLNSTSTGSAVFAQMTVKCPYTSQWATPSPLKIAPSNGGCGPHLINGSLVQPSRQPKHHLDRFSRYCRAQQCDR